MVDGQRAAKGETPPPQPWVVVAVRAGRFMGVIGPFDTKDEAVAWAAGVRMKPGTDWAHLVEEVVPTSFIGSAASG